MQLIFVPFLLLSVWWQWLLLRRWPGPWRALGAVPSLLQVALLPWVLSHAGASCLDLLVLPVVGVVAIFGVVVVRSILETWAGRTTEQ